MRVLERAERHDLGAVFLEELQILRVIEVEGVVVGDREPHARATVRLAEEDLLGDQRHQLRLARDPEQEIEVDVARDRLREHADHALPLLVLRDRQQPQLPLWDVERRHGPKRAQHRQLGRVPNGIFHAAPMTF